MKDHSQINANKMYCIIRFVENNLSKIDQTKQFGKLMEYLYINHVYLSKKEVIYLLNSSEKLYEIVGNYCDNLDYESINNKLVMKFYKYYNLIKNLNLVAKIPNIDANDKTYDEEEINGLTVYYDNLPSKILTKEEVTALYKLIEKGNNEAREKLISYNLRLVISIAKKYVGRGIELEDLIASGNEGLLIAVNKFDYTLGWSFSTYASYWITQSITKNIADNSRTIRVPVYLHERLTKIKAFIGIYYAQNMCAPSIEEISKALNFKPSQVEEAMPLLQSIISLDYTNDENEETAEDSMINFIPNDIDEVETETDKIFYEQVKDIIFNQSNLKPKAKEILAYRYGFIDNQKHTLDELSEFYGITRERVRQIEAASLKKLSSNHDLKILNLANHK